MTVDEHTKQTISAIQARLKSIREDYAVHVGCGGEAIPTTPIGTHYNCQRCEKRLPCDDIAEKMDPALSYVEDVEWLLQTISELKEALAVERQCRQADRCESCGEMLLPDRSARGNVPLACWNAGCPSYRIPTFPGVY